ncbi:MAG: hypothetical protein AB7G36_10030 [Candidatus Nanopelagicales bacterium]
MTGHTKARLWAAAGIVPAICVATWATGPTAPETAALLVMAALGWGWVSAVISEHHWQAPTVKWLERRNRQLEEQLAATENAMKVMARRQADTEASAVVDLREDGTLTRHAAKQQSEIRRRVEEARAAEHVRLDAEPTAAELAQAQAEIAAAFVDPGARYRDQP